MEQDRRYLVTTDHGDVVVVVSAAAGGLDPDLIRLEAATPDSTKDLTMATPLTAFGAKMVDLIELHGAGDLQLSPAMYQMMVREKATQELHRIERFAKTANRPTD